MQISPTEDEQARAFNNALAAMAEFRRIFHVTLAVGTIAELYVAHTLGLELCAGVNAPGYDALGSNGERYQIKYRQNTSLVDVNNFDFDYVVLVNLDDEYQLQGMWRMSALQAQALFVPREKFRKYQMSQGQFKKAAEKIL